MLEGLSQETISTPEKPIGLLRLPFDSLEEAESFVRSFWEAMPHGAEIQKEGSGNNDWGQELTCGDRTKIIVGRLPKERGKSIVLVQGNNQPLSDDAITWLRDNGYILENQ